VTAAALLVSLAAAALDPLAREALAAKLKPSILVLRIPTVSGERAAHGTGFVIRADGMVVTNHHVIAGAQALEGVFPDGRVASVVGIVVDDADHDLAVVQLDATGLKPLTLGSSEGLTEGSPVFMFGNPLGLDFTFTEGIVSAVRKDGLPKDLLPDDTAKADLQPHLQLQITTGGGSSGSPVLDEQGRVVGVNRAGMGHGLGTVAFAVPVDALAPLVTTERLAHDLRPVREFPWVNVVVSVLVAGGVVIFLRRRGGGSGRPKATRRFSGYEE